MRGGFLRTAADWLENGRPGERPDLGSPLWFADGVRALERQDGDVYRLSLVSGGSALTYEVVGIDGGCLR
ncbi:hypothetical protein B1R27_30100 [Streptomyces sp. GKU 895]|nr:hypothetical protein B1R27_30100 [Streptomyces sp. GKU 895]